jgi:hypothetical protein
LKLKVRPLTLDLNCDIYLKEPLFSALEKGPFSLVKYFSKAFALSLNDVKVNQQMPADNLIHISRMFGKGYFNLSFGLERVSTPIFFVPFSPE